jgi:hypothetical protein
VDDRLDGLPVDHHTLEESVDDRILGWDLAKAALWPPKDDSEKLNVSGNGII